MVDIKNEKVKNKAFQARNIELAVLVSKLHDDACVGPDEVSAFTGLAKTSIQKTGQRTKLNMPPPLSDCRHLSWKFGVIKQWSASRGMATAAPVPQDGQKNKGGRPTKAMQLRKLALGGTV